MTLLVVVGLCSACGPASNDGPASASSVVRSTSPDTISVPMSVVPTSAVTVTTQAPSTIGSVPESTLVGEVDVVVAAAMYRVYGAAGVTDPPPVDQRKVMERYGTAATGSFLEPSGRVIGEDVRDAVEQALAPAVVEWVSSPTDVVDDLASVEDGAHPDVVWLVTFGGPVIDGRQATIVVDMVCGGTCGAGRTYTVEMSDATEWTVTGTSDNWVA